MRLRNIKGADEVIEKSEFTFNEFKEHKGKWSEIFGNENPIQIEIGMGKGKFITQLALEHPEINYIGIERYSSKIYLNFSDPWPKDRHAKRRLTSRQFFERYDKILKQDGYIEFKTDNRDLFDFSLEEIKETKFKVIDYTFDLHGDVEAPIYKGNITTEYEDKFVEKGNKICKLIATRA